MNHLIVPTTVIDHRKRLEAKLSCDEYLILDIVYRMNLVRESVLIDIEKGGIKDMIPTDMFSFDVLLKGLAARSFIALEFDNKKIRATDKLIDFLGEEKIKFHQAEFVLMTKTEYDKLVKKHSLTMTIKAIEKLDNYFGADTKRLKKYTNHYRVILSWVMKEVITEVKMNQ